MKRYELPAAKVARGTPDPRQPERVQVVCAFDTESFLAIRERALRDRTSFAEQVRILCEWGLMDAEEAEAGGANNVRTARQNHSRVVRIRG